MDGNMKKLKTHLQLETKYAPFILLIPLLVTLLVITVFPIIYALITSFQDFRLDASTKSFIGFRNYLTIITDLRFWNGLKNTLTFSFGAIIFELFIGLIISLLLVRSCFGSSVLKSLILIPMVSTPVVISLIWILLLNPQFGLLNYFFSLLHIPPQSWLASPKQAMWALILVDVWEWTPFAVLVLIAGLQSIPEELYEAAAIDGAKSFQAFRFITLPYLEPFILIVMVFRFMDAFRWFDTIAVITKGGPGISTETWSYYGYITAFKHLDMGYSAALGVIMLFTVVFISQLFIKRIFRK